MDETQTVEAQEQQTDQTDGGSVEVNEAELPEVVEQTLAEGGGQIDILLEVPISVQVELGETSMRVRELLKLSVGSVLKLDKQAGEPVDVFLRGVKFATGQLVVVDGQLGVRLGKIVSPDSALSAG